MELARHSAVEFRAVIESGSADIKEGGKMSYWSGEPDGCDFAFGAVGALVFQTVESLEQQADLVLAKEFPEQSMLALLKILDLLIDEFPKCVAVHFRKQKYLAVKNKFLTWQRTVAKVPKKHLSEFELSAAKLFESLDQKLDPKS